MAGIYIHVPFCKQRCNYCDFYSTIQLSRIQEYKSSIIKEILLRKDFLKDQLVETIYFGGGTPSFININIVKEIFESLYSNFNISNTAEITLEANPDDLSTEFIEELKRTPVNRLSIGLQSFDQEYLELMNRRHTSQQAINCIKTAQESGFSNISIDLIYGLPNLDEDKWDKNLEKAFSLGIQHLSAYHLTYESNTVFDKWKKSGYIKEISETDSIKQFEKLIQYCNSKGFEQYEISNFALPGLESKHNSSYWFQKPYLGLGPSAHSYNGNQRIENIANLSLYISSLKKDELAITTEELSITDKYNDYLITRLRTKWGIDLNYIKNEFGDLYYNYCLTCSQSFLKTKDLVNYEDIITLTNKGKFISDAILTDLFYVE